MKFVLGMVFAILVGAGLVYLITGGADSFNSHMSEYVAMADRAGSAAMGGSVTGPAVIISLDHKAVDSLQDRLSSSMRAEKHSQVNAIIVVTRTGTGMPVGVAGMTPVSSSPGSYSISIQILDRNGTYVAGKTISKQSVASGAGFEAELRGQADNEAFAWIQQQLGG